MAGFKESYLPTAVSAAEVATTRPYVENIVKDHIPDVDTAPASATGDLVVTPIAVGTAAIDIGVSRLMSDAALLNPANGVIYSCDFVEAFLGNFGVYDLSLSPPRGIVRLNFSVDAALDINRATLIKFGTDSIWRCSLFRADSSFLSVLPSWSVPSGNPDEYILRQVAPSIWVVDIPVDAGSYDQVVKKGATASFSTIPNNLISGAALSNFKAGLGPTKLSQLAARARYTSHSASISSRAGTRALFFQYWPDSVMVSPVISGDNEMLRSTAASSLALQSPAMDIYYRSDSDMDKLTDKVMLRLIDVGGDKVFRGRITTSARPVVFEKVAWGGDISHVVSYVVFSAGQDDSIKDYFGTSSESMWMEVIPTLDDLDIPTIVVSTDDDGEYAWFDLEYRADAYVPVVRRFIENSDNAAPGLSTMLREGPIAFVTLEVRYIREPGVVIYSSVLQDKLSAYVLQVGNPNEVSLAKMHKIVADMGARYVGITLAAEITPTAATRAFTLGNRPETYEDLEGDWSLISTAIASLNVSDYNDLYVEAITDEDDFAWAKSFRTIKPVLRAINVQEL